MPWVDFYVYPTQDARFSNNKQYHFDVEIRTYFSVYTITMGWKDIVAFRERCEDGMVGPDDERIHIKSKYLKKLTDPNRLPTTWQRCQEVQDFFSVLFSNPKHYQHYELHEFLQFTYDDTEGNFYQNHRYYFEGKIEVDTQMRRFLQPIEVIEQFQCHILSPLQPQPGKVRKDPQRQYVRRKVKIMNDGRVIINRIMARKDGKHLMKDVYIAGFRVEDIIGIRRIEYGDDKKIVAIHIGLRYWALSFDTHPKAKQFVDLIEAQRTGFLKIYREIIVEDAPLHLVGVMQRQLDEVDTIFGELYAMKKKNYEIELDIKQWKEIIETKTDNLKAKEKKIMKEFDAKIKAENDAADIQNGFNQAILDERTAKLDEIMDPDVFAAANFKEINRLVPDAETKPVPDAKGKTDTSKHKKWIAKNHHFHHHLTIHKHIYHHYHSKNRKAGKDDDHPVARETHSYTKTYTQTIIDLKRETTRLIARKGKGSAADNKTLEYLAEKEDTFREVLTDIEDAIDDAYDDAHDTIREAVDEKEHGHMPLSGGL